MKNAKLLSVLAVALMAVLPLQAQKKVMLMNRIGPSQLVLYVSNADGTVEHPLFATSGFGYNAAFS